jgi:hypothetical protein
MAFRGIVDGQKKRRVLQAHGRARHADGFHRCRPTRSYPAPSGPLHCHPLFRSCARLSYRTMLRLPVGAIAYGLRQDADLVMKGAGSQEAG